ncbi:hypothetical protein [Branchiibius sp. NY16-3462-2]|uniref:hypothetical protein n=1 Tax=Branchiibius sp. NY16-3462-2 TaxID=1807500 RepID=UPI0007938FFF|nr:hypothetical protein [Branchiibius sp. NY16-3462-2]KYH45224.1 hypothetical protein AZH51_15260 [Branchiibius sp. NY16-3462-2]
MSPTSGDGRDSRLDKRVSRVSQSGRDPEPSRALSGRWRSGDITRFDAVAVDRGVALTIQQEDGPAHQFVVCPDVRRVPAVAGWLQNGALDYVAMAGTFLAFGGFRLTAGDDPKPPVAMLLIFVIAVAGLAGLAFHVSHWIRDNPRFHICPDADYIPAAVAALGSPRDAAWAKQALVALRDGKFCRASRDLHREIERQRATRRSPDAPVGHVQELLRATADVLSAHGRPADGADLLVFADVVPDLPVLDQETARQAAQTVSDSYRLLDEIPPDLRDVVPEGSSTTPSEDARAAVDAGLRGIGGLLSSETISGIAELQALRRYSQRWDTDL